MNQHRLNTELSVFWLNKGLSAVVLGKHCFYCTLIVVYRFERSAKVFSTLHRFIIQLAADDEMKDNNFVACCNPLAIMIDTMRQNEQCIRPRDETEFYSLHQLTNGWSCMVGCRPDSITDSPTLHLHPNKPTPLRDITTHEGVFKLASKATIDWKHILTYNEHKKRYGNMISYNTKTVKAHWQYILHSDTRLY